MNGGLRGGGGDTCQNVVKDIAPSLGADPSGGNTREFGPREQSVQNTLVEQIRQVWRGMGESRHPPWIAIEVTQNNTPCVRGRDD